MDCQRCTEPANTLITSNERGALKLCPSCWNAEQPDQGDAGDAAATTPRKRAAAKK